MSAERIPDVSRSVPVPGDVTVSEDKGNVVLTRRRFGGLRRAIVKGLGAEPDLVIRLDTMGSAAWRLMDGARTVGDVRVALEAKFPGEPDIKERLGKLLGTLVSREAVRLS